MVTTALPFASFLGDLTRPDKGQVSHGLNLVLELDPTRGPMALLLAKIRRAQRRIEGGLIELNFVHFARFLPTFDNRALQVITEFDGPLEPYVLDFAIEIGDVFDMLLSHTMGTQGLLPIREHPDEFLAFVKKHNAVHVLGRPIPRWPVFCAYPRQSTLEISGPRKDLPLPKPDRPATPVNREDVQGNLLRGFPADRVRHFVLFVEDAARARDWLANHPPTSDEEHGQAGPPQQMMNVGLTFAGMQALGIRDSWLALLPSAFREGPVQRAVDNADVEGNDPTTWWLGGPTDPPVHLLVSLYEARRCKSSAFDLACDVLDASFAPAGLRRLFHQDAYASNAGGFGFVDGLAHPRVAGIDRRPVSRDSDCQPASAVGEFVLGAEHRNIYGGSSLGGLPAALVNNGSFCAVRVLEQDSAGFRRFLRKEAARLQVRPDWLAAKLMGRWQNGSPVARNPFRTGAPASPANGCNDFDYSPSYEYPRTRDDTHGLRCPIGAHIRRCNPRTSPVAGARYTRRLMRRGMHYEHTDVSGQRTEGLFGLFICADLERQFEFIQRHWINGDGFAAGLEGTRDPIAGTPRPGCPDEFHIPMGSGAPLTVRLEPFVRTRGSAYLFMPSLTALRTLQSFVDREAPATPRPSRLPSLVRSLFRPLARLLQRTVDRLLAGAASLALAVMSRRNGPPAKRLLDTPRSTSPARLAFDPRERRFQVDPYPIFAQFRQREPVHYSPLYRGWFVFDYANVARICIGDDPSRAGAEFSAAPPDSRKPRGLFTLDPPRHTEVRRLVHEAWQTSTRDVASLIKQSVDEALEPLKALATHGRPFGFDLVDDFARPIPRQVYFDILGGKAIGAAQRRQIDHWARTVREHHDHTLDPLQRLDGILAGAKLALRMALLLADAWLRPARYRGSFLAELVQRVRPFSDQLNLSTAILTLVNLTVAGYMSVEFLLATSVRRLLLHPATGWTRLERRREGLPSFLHEMRRTEHALAVIDRYAVRDVTLFAHGQPITIKAGERVFGVLASANRDDSAFPRGDHFDPDRMRHKPHVGLGRGTHACMGRALEKAITTPAIGALLDLFPNLRLESTAEPPWFQNFYFRSFDHLTVLG